MRKIEASVKPKRILICSNCHKLAFQNKNMRKLFYFLFFSFYFAQIASAQTPKSYTSSEILLHLKKLNVLGSVLYIAAHPDDENTRLLAYLANEKLYRTGYLSLTRGDGGQNLIGDEQGIDLGLIRTQELLSARRIDGAEQFFSRAYDFGYCKTPEEALKTWNHDKILSDVVWVIRKFRPDVIITRFPEDGRAGHGHHSASAILAREAFDASADSTKFPEQLRLGVTVWRAKKILWNTYNFGNNNTQSEDQLKIDCGGYNALLGKSYGEIAALSRSQHKSQGFGVAAQRGAVMEYFATVKGDKPTTDLLDGVNSSWSRVDNDGIGKEVNDIINNFSAEHPERSVNALAQLYSDVQKNISDDYWRQQKLREIQNLIEECSGLFLEATTNTQYAVQGDSLKVNFIINNRLGTPIQLAQVSFKNAYHTFDSVKNDINAMYTQTFYIKPDEKLTQPYWLAEPMEKGSFNVSNQQLIGKAENDPISASFFININGVDFRFDKPVRYKYTDPVKGEVYQPIYVTPQVTVSISPSLVVFNPEDVSNHSDTRNFRMFIDGSKLDSGIEYYSELSKLTKGGRYSTTNAFDIALKKGAKPLQSELDEWDFKKTNEQAYTNIKEIDYDHIPSIKYFVNTKEKILIVDAKIVGKKIGYIPGAGDKVPQALEQMGYKVTMLNEKDITSSNLKQFDAIVTGVRAYNINEWLNSAYDTLMNYIKNGGTLLVQYNTNNSIGPIKAKMSPYPFTISINRVTDETAKINFLLPNDPALNYPNKITDKDFDGWIQERSTYDAVDIDSNYKRILSAKDPGEKEQDGSLIIANYGKGKFVYSGLVFFRELPAGVPGAYRLFANLLAKRKVKAAVKK
jgi:LmbE family N-acetylglucosaminyl deacetylase